MRSLRGDSSAQSAGADLNASLTHMTKNVIFSLLTRLEIQALMVAIL